ncbi:MAG: acyl-CoA dehydrogenase [Gammaproteobacteria bacterium]|nr:MAG: acyl-CoA dehydrogenase [Gammaproteobacteria bacterium]
MMIFLWLLGIMTLFYHEAGRGLWTGFLLVMTAITLMSGCLGLFSALLLVVLILLLIVLINAATLRMAWLSAPLFNIFRKIVPPMSATEKEAIEAGRVGWEKTLFSGKPDWKALHEMPQPSLSEREQSFLDNEVEEVCALLDDWKITHEDLDLPDQAWKLFKEKGFFGMIIPENYGGLGFSVRAHSDVIIKLASRSISAAVTVMVPNSLGPAELLLHYGTEKQRDHYLPRLAKGEEIPCFALTGPQAGSDAGSLPDRGIVIRDKSGELAIRLDFEKRYITLAPVATLIGLAFHLYDPDHLLGEQEDLGITLALLPRDTEGLEIGNRHFPANMAFMNGPIRGKDVIVGFDAIIGEQDGIGKGWRMLMESLGAGRSISLPALSVAAGKTMCLATGAYAGLREQFHHAIGRFEGVKEKLTGMAGETFIMDATRLMALAEIEAVERPAIFSAVAKYQLTEKMRRVVNHAMDIQGGSGICLGPSNVWGRVYQSVPVGITVEGANILTRSMIIFGQGAMRCHPFLLDEVLACEEAEKGEERFDAALWGHFRYIARNKVRALVLGAINPLRKLFIKDPVRRAELDIDRYSAAFAYVTDCLVMVYGGSLKMKEHHSGRMADVFSELLMAAAVLRQYRTRDHHDDEEKALLEWSMQYCLTRVAQSLSQVLVNLPFPFRLACWVVFPLGRRMPRSYDQLDDRLAELLIRPGEVRDRLVNGIYKGTERIALMEKTLKEVQKYSAEIKSVRRMKMHKVTDRYNPDQIDQAVDAGIISESVAEKLKEIERDREQIIRVDEFTPKELGGITAGP